MSSTLNINSSSMIIQFAKSTQNVCTCLGISVFLIVLLMMTPLNSFLLSSLFGKITVLILLIYALYYNIIQTNKFSNNFSINLLNEKSQWDPVTINILCSHIFSFLLLVLIISVIRKIL